MSDDMLPVNAQPTPIDDRTTVTNVQAGTQRSGLVIYPLAEPIKGPCLLTLPIMPAAGTEVGVYDVETRRLVRTVELGEPTP